MNEKVQERTNDSPYYKSEKELLPDDIFQNGFSYDRFPISYQPNFLQNREALLSNK